MSFFFTLTCFTMVNLKYLNVNDNNRLLCRHVTYGMYQKWFTFIFLNDKSLIWASHSSPLTILTDHLEKIIVISFWGTMSFCWKIFCSVTHRVLISIGQKKSKKCQLIKRWHFNAASSILCSQLLWDSLENRFWHFYPDRNNRFGSRSSNLLDLSVIGSHLFIQLIFFTDLTFWSCFQKCLLYLYLYNKIGCNERSLINKWNKR